jgi:hypothetical protein
VLFAADPVLAGYSTPDAVAKQFGAYPEEISIGEYLNSTMVPSTDLHQPPEALAAVVRARLQHMHDANPVSVWDYMNANAGNGDRFADRVYLELIRDVPLPSLVEFGRGAHIPHHTSMLSCWVYLRCLCSHTTEERVQQYRERLVAKYQTAKQENMEEKLRTFLQSPIQGAETSTDATISENYNDARKHVDVFDQREKLYNPRPGRVWFHRLPIVIVTFLARAQVLNAWESYRAHYKSVYGTIPPDRQLSAWVQQAVNYKFMD